MFENEEIRYSIATLCFVSVAIGHVASISLEVDTHVLAHLLGLRQPKYNRTPITLADLLHRTLVTGLAALSIYGIYLGYSVHEHVMTKGKGVYYRWVHLSPVPHRLICILFVPPQRCVVVVILICTGGPERSCDAMMPCRMQALAVKEAETKTRQETQVGDTFVFTTRVRSECDNKAAEEAREQSLAEAAQAVLQKRS
ncbi:hypothetical protein JVT61DRAFT_596 [Boletus reticuloceps]|uniref:Uncharacterized protein n=1 Tax=Boletus reticuloceps TaxID=495285 RepID=A0A8I3AE20_9AGAM|nr:hypothetical protein JVT61DRAFT_596 [Boletus reticuloceps]